MYLPLDPSHPPGRLRFALEKSAAAVLLLGSCHFPVTEVAFKGALVVLQPARPGSAVVSPAGSARIPPCPKDASCYEAQPGDPAYILFTSGSTGDPKGVRVPHRGLLNYLTWFVEYNNLNRDDRWLHVTNPCFDPSLFELLAPLLVGATVVCAGGGQGTVLDTHAIVSVMGREAVTGAYFPPTTLGLLVVTPGFSELHLLRNCIIGAEKLHGALLKRAMAALPNCCFANYYGPTETTINVTACKLDSRHTAGGSVPIGSPVQAAVLFLRQQDGTLLPTEPGASGELCVGGPMVALGYLGEPEKTEKVRCTSQ